MTIRLCDSCEHAPASLLVTFEDDTTYEVCVGCTPVAAGVTVIELVAAAV